MAAQNGITNPYGQCKCCLQITYLKNMWEPQENNGQWEVYGQMLVDCFAIDWTILAVEEDNICQVCISKLRVATAFKQQIELSQATKDPVGVVAAIEEVVSTERVQVETIPSLDGKEVEVNFVLTSPKKDTIPSLILTKPSLVQTEPTLKTEEVNSITVPLTKAIASTSKNKVETIIINSDSVKQWKAANKPLLKKKNINMIPALKSNKDTVQACNTPLTKQNTISNNGNVSMVLKKDDTAIHLKELTPSKMEQASYSKKGEIITEKNEGPTTAVLAKENTSRHTKEDDTVTVTYIKTNIKHKHICSKEKNINNTNEIERLKTVQIQFCDSSDEIKTELKCDDDDDDVFEDMEYLEEIDEANQDENMEYLEEIYKETTDIKNEENDSEMNDTNDEGNESENYEINDDDDDDDLDDEDEEFQPKPKRSKSNSNQSTNSRTIKRRSKRKLYTKDDLMRALEAVKGGRMSRREASKVYHVPRCKITDEDVMNLPEDYFQIQLVRATRAIIKHTNATPFKMSGEGSFRCFYCGVKGAMFRHPDKLREHTHHKHTDKINPVDEALRPPYLHRMVRFDIYNLKCCSQQISWNDLQKHLEINHGVTNIDTAWDNIVPYKLTVDSDVITCVLCDFSACFSTVDTHMNKHYPNYLCGECGKEFVSEWRLRCHIAQFHKNGKFACNQCSKVFLCKKTRYEHQKSMHSAKFKCSICAEKFRTEKETDLHMKEHADLIETEGKYCNLCGNYFWPKEFDKHLKLEHDGLKPNSSVKKFKCAICLEMFFKKQDVVEHIAKEHE